MALWEKKISATEGESLITVAAMKEDIDRAFESGHWCQVLALPEVVEKSLIYVFCYQANAITHSLSVGKWTHVTGLVYELEILGFEEMMDPIPVRGSAIADETEILCGEAGAFAQILGSEIRSYPAGIETMDRMEMNLVFRTSSIRQYQAYRQNPDWASSLRHLAAQPCFSDMYRGCEQGLAEEGIRKGFITFRDIDESRKRAGVAVPANLFDWVI